MSLELADDFWPAYNNLGRLYLRAQSDPDAALATLLAGQRRADNPLGQAVIGKNVAWAYLERGLPRASLATLEQVITDLQEVFDAQNDIDKLDLDPIRAVDSL